MPKERSVNPAQAQRKADKQKEINKNKKNIQNQRNEKLAKRNPDRLQRQIDELKELEGRGALRPKDKETLAQLERDVKGIRRAREALGDAAPKFPSHERRDGAGGRHDRQDRGDARDEQRERRQHLGKRRREEEHREPDSDTDPEVRDIPMPRDTPPPLPRQDRRREPFTDPQVGPDGQRLPHALPTKPAVASLPPAQLVYTSAPQLRDLKKEATRFVPSAVAQKKKRVKGEGRLLEPEEIEKLEKAGYYAAEKAAEEAEKEEGIQQVIAGTGADGDGDLDMDAEMKKLEFEMNGIESTEGDQNPRRQVQMEEVDDDGD
ncbi:unnamed protein product [Zymoseptoria tritici ST99CH_1E4]|uniref:Wbp11/ELF5/Saf1 N-terminal domain-containing protein n=2 Tax=Zymoseptoria tritici TaxID=1047171 RepID=A0A2H1GAJ7_ZYMTR|nr:unnamed protein product [Zymoseptoria tritici ST99CH_1E4]